MTTILAQLRKDLKNNVDEHTKNSSKRFFKEEIKSYGIKVPMVNQIAKTYFTKIKGESKSDIFALCENLWSSGLLEESFVACHWSYAIRKQFEKKDFKTFEKWINSYVSNWASCDTFCNHSVGEFLEMYPEYLVQLKKWAASRNRWMRRASAVSLIVPARKGLFLHDILQIAEMLVTDEDDLVQKGYGWMLKVSSEAHQKEVFDFVIKHKSIMPRTALRYAIEKLPAEMKAEAMKKNVKM